MAQKIVAFVAKSFDAVDEAKIAPILKVLDSFSKLGFIADSAEQSEVESVSEKVRSLIDKSNVFVGIFTKRHPVYRFKGPVATAIAALTGKLKPDRWSAPPWVLQESGYALKAKMPLILFREIDVEIPGLQGDLEYIPYDPRNPTPAFQRVNEMINGLIAKAANITVDTVVHSEAVEITEVIPPPKPSEKEANLNSGTSKDSLEMVLDLYKVIVSRDWEKSESVYKEGLHWIEEHEPERVMLWKCFYLKTLFSEGRTDALDLLRNLAAKNPTEYLPESYLASCFVDLREYTEGVKHYLQAASLAGPSNRAQVEINAAGALRKGKKVSEARELLLRVRVSDYAANPKTQFLVLKELYFLAKETEDKFRSLAIAELALRQAPEESAFRFSLAFDYGAANQESLSAYHYKIVCEQDDKNASALNNLGVSFSRSDLHVLAVDCYKKS